jgi:hypothetical protein
LHHQIHPGGRGMKRFSTIPAALLFVCVTSPQAAPKIEFDTKTFRCDTVVEDQVEKISAVFKVTNTGDQPLKIETVRPGCGCTNVKFDSTVKPGKSSKISAEVTIKGYKAGTISKGITITSNAANEKDVRLTITATITSPVEMSDINVNFGGTDTATTRTITLVSKKHDLSVTGVSFKENAQGNTPGWQSELRLPITYKLVPLDSIRNDGARLFSLKLNAPKVEKSVSGVMVIATNHPEKPELSLQAYINKQ